jgi:predicted metalloprotease with PDZ domain
VGNAGHGLNACGRFRLKIPWNCTDRELKKQTHITIPQANQSSISGTIAKQVKPRSCRSLLSCAFLLFIATSSVNGQAAEPTIRVTVSSAEAVKIDVHLQRPVKSWSFLNSYAAALGLGSRIDEFQARRSGGETVPVKSVAPGEFRSDESVVDFSYRVRLTIPRATEIAHISWLTPQNGLLMFADLLPQDPGGGPNKRSMVVDFQLPANWTVHSALSRNEKQQFVVEDTVKAVFIVGESVKIVSKTIEGMKLDLALTGVWPFKDENAVKAAARVLKKCLEVTGFKLPTKSVVMIAPMPVADGITKWTAETRGSTSILLLDQRTPFRNWIAQLEVILTHELFHLWVPNSLSLEGDYDWFFEGFTLYQALLTARESNLISFQELLNTLARVYDSYRSSPELLSLIEASERRWTGSNSAIYDKGMLVAFLYDLMLREESGGKTRLSQKYRQLFSEYSSKSTNGNEAIMSLLRSSSSTDEFLKSQVESRNILNLEQLLVRYGLLVDIKDARTHLRVADRLSKDQLRLLRSLGYKR